MPWPHSTGRSAAAVRYQGKTALITGAGAGIGRAIAERLGAEGAAVVALDRDPDGLAETEAILAKAGISVLAALADVTDTAAIGAALAHTEDRFGRLDVLVNNAAFTIKGSIADTGPDDWDAEVAVTLKGPYICARAALPGMAARGSGVIINIGSVNGLVALGNPAYSAAKAGLLSFTKSLATEYGPKGIRANMISPGSVVSESPSWRMRLEKEPDIFEKLARWYPVGRVGLPEDIAAAVAFMAADEAGFVNGANLVVDGGLTAGIGPMMRELTLQST